MKINLWRRETMSAADLAKVMSRAETDIDHVMDVVRPIIADVKARGDAALVDYAKKFDRADIKGRLKATNKDFDAAYAALDPKVTEAIRGCAKNVKRHHEQQMERVEPYWLEEVSSGVYAGEKVTPVPSVGLYVPRGKGAFPSVMYMLCTPAKIAGVKQIVVCTPPTPDGGAGDCGVDVWHCDCSLGGAG
jgi:histidinol dehydrogenase